MKLTFQNPDVVPHNWVLIKPGSLERVGDWRTRSSPTPTPPPATTSRPAATCSSTPTSSARRRSSSSTSRAPKEKGRYPYLCTFPGHWMVMNGQMIVE